MTQDRPDGALMPFLLTVLTPFLMAGGIPDPGLARQAATETIAAYQAAGDRQLLATGQIIAFALAALENLRLSAPPDLSPSLKLKLRGNATALNRTSQKAADTLETQRAAPRSQVPEQAKTEAPLKSAPIRTPTSDRKHDLRWGQAMTDIAAEYTAELPVLPPDRRQAQLTRIDALSTIAGMLVRGDAPPLRSRLLAGAAMPG